MFVIRRLPTNPAAAGGRRASLLLLAVALLAGCRREAIAVYRVPKENEAPAARDSGAEPAPPRIQWKLPAGWEEQAAGEMSLASFSIPGEAGKKAQLSVMTFPGEGAGELDLINIVRENAGLTALTGDDLTKLVEPVNVGEGRGKLVDLTGAVNGSDNSRSSQILVAVYPRDGVTWFFKFAGDRGVVAAQKTAFVDFLKSISWVERPGVASRKPHFASTNDKRVPGDGAEAVKARPSWEIPAGWQEAPPSQMLLAKFVVGGKEGQAEVTVSAFPGDTGGLLANVNRWRGQVGLGPVDEAGMEQQVTRLDVAGGDAMLVDMSGTSAKTGKTARLIGIIWPREGQTWFYKLMGDPAVAEREKAAFVKFVQSARYPNA